MKLLLGFRDVGYSSLPDGDLYFAGSSETENGRHLIRTRVPCFRCGWRCCRRFYQPNFCIHYILLCRPPRIAADHTRFRFHPPCSPEHCYIQAQKEHVSLFSTCPRCDLYVNLASKVTPRYIALADISILEPKMVGTGVWTVAFSKWREPLSLS